MSSNLTETIYKRYVDILKDQRLPALILDKDNLNKNINDIALRADRLKIRIASKSVRCLTLLKYVLESSSKYQGILCFSAEEAVFLSQNGLDDLVIAYPTSQLKALDAVAEEVKKGKKIYPMVDCAEHLKILKQVAQKHNTTLSYCLEIDMSMKLPAIHFGVMRSPVRNLKDVESILKEDAKYPEIQLKGVM
ncbi:MAG: alanine racemase, partial [Bdellovibrionales bacterium]|nr:alanine racemase [Bdellovibrionales bacterium]